MTKTLIAALALAGAAAFPALAQDSSSSSSQNQGQNQNQTRPMQAQTPGGGQPGQAGQSGQMTAEQMQSRIASQQQVREALTQSGFEEVNLLDAAYLVSARAPSGEMVMMVVNPSGLMQGMMQGGATGSVGQGGSGSGGMMQNPGQSGGSGTSGQGGQTNQ